MSQASISPEVASSTTERVAAMAHDTIDRVTAKTSRAQHELRDAAAKAAQSGKLLQGRAVEAAEDNVRKLRSYSESNPFITAGIAFAVGALLGAMLRR
jgi:ElaB/YqjD/DUF883 family membrane-anchored ribosome-binding protein